MFSLLRMFGFLLFHFKYERFDQKYFSHIRFLHFKGSPHSSQPNFHYGWGILLRSINMRDFFNFRKSYKKKRLILASFSGNYFLVFARKAKFIIKNNDSISESVCNFHCFLYICRIFFRHMKFI